MNALIHVVNELGRNALPMFLNAVWQCGAVFFVAFAAIALCRPRSPLTRHLVWLLALVGMAACPLVMLTGHVGGLRLVRVPLSIDAPGSATERLTPTVVGQHDAVSGSEDPAMLGVRHEASPGETAAVAADASEPAHLDARRAAPSSASVDRAAVHPPHVARTAARDRTGGVQWPAIALAVWAAGALLLLGRFIVAQLAVRRLIARSAPARRESLRRALDSAKALVGVRRSVELRVSSELAVPVAAGVFRPCVLFPEALARELPESELDAIAVHELTHIKRMDPAVMALERLVQAVLFFHPAVWLAGRALSAAREELCDEAVVRATRKPVAYARCLTSLFEHVRVLSHCRLASVGAAHYRSKLGRRVETLLSGRMLLLGRLPHGLKAAVIGAACAALVLIGGTSFVRAQAADDATATSGEDTAKTARGTAESCRWVDCSPSGGGISAVAMCTAKPDVLYAATSHGVFKTTDGAATWTPTAPRGDRGVNGPANDVAVDPADPDVVYAASGRLCKSVNGGESWDIVPVGDRGGDVVLVETDPQAAYTLYVLDQQRGVFKSADGGETWESKSNGLESFELWRFEVDPRVPRVLWGSSREKAYVTTDGADTWRTVELPFSVWNLRAIRAGGEKGDLLYAGTADDVYYYSDNGGESWEHLYSAEDDPDGERTTTIDELRTCFLFGLPGIGKQTQWQGGPLLAHPEKPDVVYRVEYSLATLLKTEDFGKHWTSATKGITAFESRGIACSPDTPGLVCAAGRDGVYKSLDAGKTWKQLCTDAWSGPPLVVHPLDPKTLLIATGDDRVRISTDGGATWRQIDRPDRSRIETFVFDPDDADTFYALTGGAVLKTTDHGETWESTGGSIQISFGGGDWRSVTQTNADVIYEIVDWRHLLRSTDVGQSWTEIMTLDEKSAVSAVYVDPADPKIVIAAGGDGRLHVSRDAGDTWQEIERPAALGDRGIARVAIDPQDPDVFYVACRDRDQGILRTLDGGATFEVLNSGLPGEEIVQIAVSPADGTVYAGTDGAGLYRLDTGDAQAKTAGE